MTNLVSQSSRGATANGCTPDPAIVQADVVARRFDLQEHPAHIVRRVHQRAGVLFQQMVDAQGLSPTQFAVLATLLRHGDLSQTQLCRHTAMDPSTATVVIRKLIRQNLVHKDRSARDSRLSIVSLTEEGRNLAIVSLDQSAAVGQALLSPLSIEEQKILIGFLKRLIADDEAPLPHGIDGTPAGQDVGKA